MAQDTPINDDWAKALLLLPARQVPQELAEKYAFENVGDFLDFAADLYQRALADAQTALDSNPLTVAVLHTVLQGKPGRLVIRPPSVVPLTVVAVPAEEAIQQPKRPEPVILGGSPTKMVKTAPALSQPQTVTLPEKPRVNLAQIVAEGKASVGDGDTDLDDFLNGLT